MSRLSTCVPLMILALMLGQSSSAKKCCSKYHPAHVALRDIKYYVEQGIKEHCSLKAVIFHVVSNKTVCSDPEKKWVKRAKQHVPDFHQWRQQQ